MANTKISDLPAMTTPSGSDLFPVVDDPNGSAATQKITFANAWTNYFRGQGDSRFALLSPTALSASSSSGTLTLNYSTAQIFTTTLSENVSTLTISNWPTSGTHGKILIYVAQDETGGRTFSWPSGVIWPDGTAPTVTATASAVDAYILTTTDGGTTVYGHIVGQNFS